MMRTALVLLGAVALACGGDDSGGSSGSGGSAGGGSGGTSGGATGGAAGSSSGGVAGSASGGAAGSSSICSSTTKPFSSVDCAAACQHFTDWGTSGSSCNNPYAGNPDCPLACETIKDGIPYSNALFGCAAQESDCSAFQQCFAKHCG